MSTNPIPNPYVAPEGLDRSESQQHDGRPLRDSAREAFLAWEWLRIFYNAALAAVVLLAGHSYLGDVEFWRLVVTGALLANVCFCLGPVFEGYLALLGADRRLVRWIIFVPGTLLGCGLALAAMAAWSFQGF